MKMASKIISCDHVLNSHDKSVCKALIKIIFTRTEKFDAGHSQALEG